MKRTIFIAATLLVFAFTLLSGCGNKQEIQTQKRLTAVKTQVVTRSNERFTKTYAGSVEGRKQAVVYAKIAEAVEQVRVGQGDHVKAGQLLITLDRYGSSSQYIQTQSLYKNAEKNFKKMDFLFNEGAISESEHDAAKTELEIRKAAFDAARKLVEIESPIDGVVTDLNVSSGDYLSIGQQLATVADVSSLRIKVGVNTADASEIREGSTVLVRPAAGLPVREGTVADVARSADPTTRNVQVEVDVPNPKGDLAPGTFCEVEFTFSEVSNVIVIPRDAVIEVNGTFLVFTVNGNKAVRREVTISHELEGRAIIESGLNEGDTLVVLGQDFLADGDPVNITEVVAAS